MRVLHVIPSVAARYGGPSTAVRGMTEALVRRGVDVTVATTDADGPGRLDVPLDRAVMENGTEYRYFSRTLPGEYKYSRPLARWIREHVRDFAAVHVHALFSYSTIPGCRYAERSGVPYVLRPLGTLGAWGLAQKSWKKAPYLALVERRHLRSAAAVHATSGAEAEAVRALGYGVRTRVIPLGVDVVGSGILARRAGGRDTTHDAASRRPLRVLFLSRLHAKKGLPLLFDALRLAERDGSPGVELTVAGDGAPAYVAELRRLAAASPLRNAVRFVGHLEGAAKAAAFESADLFVLPSSDENFGIAAAEALASGVPVLLSEGVALGAEVAAAGAGVVLPLSAELFARELTRFAVDRGSLARMSEAAVALARREFSWDRTAADLEALYREVAGMDRVGR